MKILILLLLISGCAAKITPADMEKAKKVCERSGGLHHIHAADNASIFAVCNYTYEGESELKDFR